MKLHSRELQRSLSTGFAGVFEPSAAATLHPRSQLRWMLIDTAALTMLSKIWLRKAKGHPDTHDSRCLYCLCGCMPRKGIVMAVAITCPRAIGNRPMLRGGHIRHIITMAIKRPKGGWPDPMTSMSTTDEGWGIAGLWLKLHRTQRPRQGLDR